MSGMSGRIQSSGCSGVLNNHPRGLQRIEAVLQGQRHARWQGHRCADTGGAQPHGDPGKHGWCGHIFAQAVWGLFCPIAGQLMLITPSSLISKDRHICTFQRKRGFRLTGSSNAQEGVGPAVCIMRCDIFHFLQKRDGVNGMEDRVGVKVFNSSS